jgi:acyl carrier protein
MIKHIDIISKALSISKNLSKKVKESDKLEKYTWDSMSIINLISIVDEKYDKKLNIDKILKQKTIKDLNNYISKNIK